MDKLKKYQKGADAGDNEFTSFVNYMVTKKVEGKYKLNRILMVCAYVIVAIIYASVFTVIIKMPALLTFLPIIIWMMTYFTWPFVNIEYEYTIVGGVLRAREVYGLRMYRELFSVRLSQMTLIAPYNGENRDKAEAAEIAHR